MEALHQAAGMRVIGDGTLARCTEDGHELPKVWDSNRNTSAPKCATHPERKWAAVQFVCYQASKWPPPSGSFCQRR